MALKRRDLLGVAGLVALVLIAALPPRTCGETQPESLLRSVWCGADFRESRSHRHVANLRNVQGALVRRLRLHALAESLRVAEPGRSVRNADGSVVVLYEPPLRPDSARRWLALAVGERDRIPGDRWRTRVVLALQSDPRRRRRDGPIDRTDWWLGSGAARWVSATPHDTTCFVVIRFGSGWGGRSYFERDGRGDYGSFLGSCGLVARFGRPGPAVAKVVEASFGEGLFAFGGQTSTAVLSEREYLKPRAIDPEEDYRLAACIRGDATSCGQILGFGPVVAPPSTWNFAGPYLNRSLMLYQLHTREPELFGRFWRSTRLVGDALGDAYGAPGPVVARDWMHGNFEIRPRGDTKLAGSTSLTAAVWLLLGIAAALAIGVRRQAV